MNLKKQKPDVGTAELKERLRKKQPEPKEKHESQQEGVEILEKFRKNGKNSGRPSANPPKGGFSGSKKAENKQSFTKRAKYTIKTIFKGLRYLTSKKEKRESREHFNKSVSGVSGTTYAENGSDPSNCWLIYLD